MNIRGPLPCLALVVKVVNPILEENVGKVVEVISLYSPGDSMWLIEPGEGTKALRGKEVIRHRVGDLCICHDSCLRQINDPSLNLTHETETEKEHEHS